MCVDVFLPAALLLSLERICYVVVWRAPAVFQAWCARPLVRLWGGPVDVLQWLFTGFKVLQVSVFFWWCHAHGGGVLWPPPAGEGALALGAGLIVWGQFLNFSVFRRIGRVGVFYGNRLGHALIWSSRFPFSHFKHPQYVGAVCSIWGLFLALRFPHDDWYVLPALETVYYVVGSYFEEF